GHGRGHHLHLLEELRVRRPQQHRLLGDEGRSGAPGAAARGGARRAPDPRQRHQPRRGGARLRHLRRRLGRLAREGVRRGGGEARRVLRPAHPAEARGASRERRERRLRAHRRGPLAHHRPAHPGRRRGRGGVPAMSTPGTRSPGTPAPPTSPPPRGGPVAVAAVDLGATSGRVMLGVLEQGRIELLPAHRFENRLAERDGHLCWDVDALWAEIRQGLTEAHRLARGRGPAGLSSIGIDSWAVDYALLGPDEVGPDGTPVPGSGARIGEVIAYRDSRTETVADEFARRVSRQRQFALTGIAQQSFNTLYQLAAEHRLAELPPGSSLLMVPDLL